MGEAKRKEAAVRARVRNGQPDPELLQRLHERNVQLEHQVARLEGDARDRKPTRRGGDYVTYAEVATMIENAVRSGLRQYTLGLARRRYEHVWHRRLRRAIAQLLDRLRRPAPTPPAAAQEAQAP
jgi:hypothetical protein